MTWRAISQPTNADSDGDDDDGPQRAAQDALERLLDSRATSGRAQRTATVARPDGEHAVRLAVDLDVVATSSRSDRSSAATSQIGSR